MSEAQQIQHGMDVAPGTAMPEDFELGDGVRRDSRCVEEWPECESGEYDPRCCRFPKSCSATSVPNRVYRTGILEPAMTTANPEGVPSWWGPNVRAFGPEEGVKGQPEAPLEPSMRVRSPDYGDGTVVAILATGVQIMWDEPWLEGVTGPQLLVHEFGFAAGLERL